MATSSYANTHKTLDFTLPITAPKDKNLKLIGKPFTLENVEEITQWAVNQAHQHDAWSIFFNLSKKELYELYFLPMFVRSMLQNLGIVFYHAETGEISALCCYED